MRQRGSIALALCVALAAYSSSPSAAQTRPTTHRLAQLSATSAQTASWGIAGKWTYRSYLNRPDVIVNDDAQSAAKALSLIFGEGIMTLTTPTPTTISGTFDMGGGYVLDLHGTIQVSAGQTRIVMFGPGRPGTPTAGWEYDYEGVLTTRWPKGVDQIPAIVGSVFRAKPHGTAKAGVVASFISLKQP